MAKLRESNLYPSKGYVKDGKLIGPPIGSVVPDTKVPLKKKKRYKERIQQLAQDSGNHSFRRSKRADCILHVVHGISEIGHFRKSVDMII